MGQGACPLPYAPGAQNAWAIKPGGDRSEPTMTANATATTAAPAPAPIVRLTPAQRAAQTRAANKGLTNPAKAQPSAQRGAGVELELVISETGSDGGALTVRFRFRVGEEPAKPDQIAPGELALTDLRVIAWAEKGELVGHHTTRLSGTFQAEELSRAVPVMARIDRFLALARAESEDDSFAQTVAALAGHLRASRIVHGDKIAKRGAAYVTALRIGEEFLAKHPA